MPKGIPEPVEPRLLRGYKVDVATGCWLWQGQKNNKGYGFIGDKESPSKNGLVLVHRAAWKIFNGPIPDGMFVLHRCDVPLCYNPEHLFLGTQRDNMMDALNKGRRETPEPQRGEEMWKAKLTEETVREIRKSRAPLAELADKYGVTMATISKVRLRQTWAHVSD